METVLQLITVQKDRVSNLERQRDIFRHEQTPKNSKFILNKKLEIFQRIYQDFLDSHIQIAAFGAQLENNDYFRNSTFDKLHQVYFEILADFDLALETIADQNERTMTTATNATRNHSNKVKLPPLQMPKFSGKYIEWSSFWDQFNAMFHVDPQLPDVQKMQFLQSAVQGPAANIIRHLPVTDNNYAEARRLLQARFENRRAIFTNAMNQLLSIPRSKKDSVSEIQQLSSLTHETMQCFKNIQAETASTILAHLVIDKFPPETRKEFERKIAGSRELPTIEEVHEQLELALRTVESLQSHEDPQTSTKLKSKTVTSFHTQPKMSSENSVTPVKGITKCVMCQEAHSIRDCAKFLELSAELRRKEAQKLKLCFNCLSSQHIRTKCKSKFGCRQCGQRHHSLLHAAETEIAQTTADVPSTSEVKILTSNYSNELFQPTLLSTAIVKVQSANGSFIPMRALIDGGGTASAITSSAVQLLQLPQVKCHIDVTHLDEAQSKSSSIVSFSLKSNVNEFEINVQALVMKSLTSLLPSDKVNGVRWTHIDSLELADPTFAQPGPVDLILGAEVYAEIMLPDIRKGPKGTPTAQKTEFGWILLGKIRSIESTKQISMLHTIVTNPTIEQLMDAFLRTEDIERENESSWSKEDQYCFDFFKQTTKRDEDGLFIIRFPFRSTFDQSAVLGHSRATVLRQFLSLEKRFMRNPEYKTRYAQNIHDFRDSGHLTEMFNVEEKSRFQTETRESAFKSFYLPHHPVIRESSSSTPVRIVFNASKPSSNGKSLNDVIFPGPMCLGNLLAILLNWRFHKIAFIADIQKMYRQIRVHKDDMKYQMILWRDNPTEPVKDYAINRLAFGINYAPSAAVQTVHALAEENQSKHPQAAQILKNSVYMDDLSSGSFTVERALQLQADLLAITSSANLNFKKWASNSDEVLLAVPESCREVKTPLNLNPEKTVKTLGIHWNATTDNLSFQVKLKTNPTVTKRTALSIIAGIYDPLGLVSPVIVMGKIFMREVWISKFEWDQPLNDDLLAKWNNLTKQISLISDVSIPRWIGSSPESNLLEIHGFCDASFDAYGAMLFLRYENSFGQMDSTLIISKSRVAPMKSMTIPRLELCAAVLLADLTKFAKTSINVIKPNKVYLWTDSEIVLHWIHGNSTKWKPFVANRINKILNLTNGAEWNYVPSKENPADLISRGASSERLTEFWFKGPSWLTLRELPQQPFKSKADESIVSEEIKRMQSHLQVATQTPTEQLLAYCSSSIQLVRFTSWFRRFGSYLRNKSTVSTGPLTVNELGNSLDKWFFYVQHELFSREIDVIKTQITPRKHKVALRKLSPFLDTNEILRVGGRLTYSEMKFEEKHPVILPREHKLTELLILRAHQDSLHGGIQITLAQLRRSCWILRARKTIRSVIDKCVICQRVRGQTATQLMADLPAVRVTRKRPFLHTGVDFCGPFRIRLSKIRGSKIYKGYVALFVCMTIKAVHLEPVRDLSSESFLMAFQRLVSRRGICTDLYSDCGTNFVGAKKLLDADERAYIKSLHESLVNQFANQGVTFHFNPPAAPSFGGLWESNVRRVKHHLKRIIGDRAVTFEFLSTLLARIEAVLNSRPLTPASDDPNDFNFLTPGHFLIGEALTAIPEPCITSDPVQFANEYRTMLKQVQTFWNIWQKDYLQTLQTRPKWLNQMTNLKIGDVVLIKDTRLPPLKWLMGRIIETHPGADGLVRVCTIKTQMGIFKRPINKLAPLPIEVENEN